MVTSDGFAKVLDFGLAKLTERREADPHLTSAPTLAADATGEGILVGTTGYMSPEQVQGKAVDHRSDIFSFGCVLYEAVTRRRPFVADSAFETMHKILNEKPAPVEELNPRAPTELRRLVRRCLAKSPDQRVQSMKDVALELREIVDEWDALSISATSAGSGSGASVRPVPTAKLGLSRALVAVLALGAVAAVVGAMWMLKPRGGGDPAPPALHDMKISAQTNRGDVTEAAISPDGRYLAYLTGVAGQVSVRVRQVATGSDVQVVPAEDGFFQGLSFSQDGNYLFYSRSKRDAPRYKTLMQVPSLGGESHERAFDVDSRVSFSPDGKRVAFIRIVTAEGKYNLIVLDLDAGKERVLATIADPQVLRVAPAWSPDGRRIAVMIWDSSSGGLTSTLAMLDPETGAREDVDVARAASFESLAWVPDGSGIVRSGYAFGSSLSREIWLVSYPGGKVRRITSDLCDYTQLTVSAGEEAIAAVRRERLSNLWMVDAPTGPGRSSTPTPPRPITRFTNAESSPLQFDTTDVGSIVFAGIRDDVLGLLSIASPGAEVTHLTTGKEIAANFRAFHGGVAYDRYEADGRAQVWRIGLDGTAARSLTPDWMAQLVDVTRDGSVLVVLRADKGEQWVVPANGGEPRSLGVATAGGTTAFSPDGTRILIPRIGPGNDGLEHLRFEIVSTAPGPQTTTPAIPEDVRNVNWSPDGGSVTYMDRTNDHWNIYRVRLPAGRPEALTRFTEGRCVGYRWSPDGRRIAIIRYLGEARNIWLTEPDGSRPIQITNFTAERIFGMEWTKDGKAIVVNAGTESNDAVLIRNFR
jgi:Tol biopolymer transport system component